jgi:hypothetical protein
MTSIATVSPRCSFDLEEAQLFNELTQELLDLTVTEKGVGLAVYAAADDPCSSSSALCCCWDLCCHICW